MNTTSAPNSEPETGDVPEEQLFIIEGSLSRLTSKRGTVNLLNELKANSTSQNIAAGVVGAVGGAANLVANASILNMYEGELVDNFACKIGDHVVIGKLSGIHLIKNGDHLKAVVSRRHVPKKGEVLYAHALLRPQDELLWLPGESDRGSRVVFKGQMMMAFFLGSAVSIFFAIVAFFHADDLVGTLLWAIAPPLLLLPLAAWVYRDLKPMALYAERIFTVLGFPDVKNLDMRDGMYAAYHRTHEESELCTYYYQAVLDARRTGTKAETHIKVPSLGDEENKLYAEGFARETEEKGQAEAKEAAKKQRKLERQRQREEKAHDKSKN